MIFKISPNSIKKINHMTRVKRGVTSMKTRRNVLKKVKGYRFGRSTKETAAYEALVHAGKYSFAHRKDKKNDFRRIWSVQIGSVLKTKSISYSKFIGAMKKKSILVDRKIMALLAEHNPASFNRLITEVIK
jgi:large subunit ribosomal protein L20